MEAYGELAKVYDVLTDDFDYTKWCSFYLDLINRSGGRTKRVLECGCGTGKMSVELIKRGINLTASDISEEMLYIATAKARSEGLKAVFAKQDMRFLTVGHKVDAIICACDGVNYLTETDDVSKFFEAAYASLKDGGVLAFDISSPHKLKDVIGSGFFGETRDDVAYLWQGMTDGDLIKMNIAFFIKENDGRYRRFDEEHIQRAHTKDEIISLLSKAGFDDIKAYGDVGVYEYSDETLRIHFTALKRTKE